MKPEDLKPGVWVQFSRDLTDYEAIGGEWKTGEIAMVKWRGVHQGRECVRVVSSKDPKRASSPLGMRVTEWLRENPVPNPFETGAGIKNLPDSPAPFICGVVDHDLLPDP